MSADVQHVPSTLPEPTDARFSMRGMLIVMAVIAILAGIGGAHIRRCPPEAQTRLLLLWTAWLAIAIGWSYYQILMRKRAETLAGKTLLRVVALNHSITLASAARHVIVGVVLVLIMLYFAGESITSTLPRKMPIDWLLMFGIPIGYSVWALSRYLPLLCWQHHVKFCEYGILWDRRLLPWDHVCKYKWTGNAKDSLEIYDIDDLNLNPWLEATVPPREREQVASLLTERTCIEGKLLWGSKATGIGQVPISSLVGTKVFRRHLGALFICVSMGLGLAYLAWSNAGTAPPFDDSIFVSFFLLVPSDGYE